MIIFAYVRLKQIKTKQTEPSLLTSIVKNLPSYVIIMITGSLVDFLNIINIKLL